MKKLQLLLLTGLAILLIACGGGQNPPPTSESVNGFGDASNHVHSLVTLPDANHTLLLATHFGVFRSQDRGATWQETAAGSGQLMHNLMAYNLVYSPFDAQRLYLLTQVAAVPYTSTIGLYTSADAGQTWKLAIASASLPTGSIFFVQAGNDNPSQVYIYLNQLGPEGLRVSMDNGQHFSQAGSSLPFGNVLGLLVVPDKPGHLIAYGNDGAAITTDSGKHWKTVSGIQGSLFEMTTPGPNAPIYARGDAGIYVSHDQGKSFSLVYTQHSFASLTASPQQPDVLYGKTGQNIYQSTDGGKNWSQLPVMQISQKSLTGDVLTADPTNANQVYLAISYPVVTYHFQSSGQTWKSITPPAHQ